MLRVNLLLEIVSAHKAPPAVGQRNAGLTAG
jgi:hypothetical protein